MATLDVFTQAPVYVRHTHPNGFRSGQWAEVVGVEWVPERHGANPRPGRACYRVRFVDGQTDLWPVCETDLYEFTHYVSRAAQAGDSLGVI